MIRTKQQKDSLHMKNCDEGLYCYYNTNCENLKQEIDIRRTILYLKNKKIVCILNLICLSLGLLGGIFGLTVSYFPLFCLGFGGFGLSSYIGFQQMKQYFHIKNDIKSNRLEYTYMLKENRFELSSEILELEKEFDMNQTSMLQVKEELEQLECELKNASNGLSSCEEPNPIEVNLYNVSFTQIESTEENKEKCKIKCWKRKFGQMLNSNSSYMK